MKHPSLLDANTRFSAPLRHYHRSGTQTRLSWDEWVDGKAVRSGSIKWLKIILSMMAMLTIGGIIAGLIVTLRTGLSS